MKIILNNREEIFKVDKLTIDELIKLKNFSFRLLVTKINGELVKKENRGNAIIVEGDTVAVIHMISGG